MRNIIKLSVATVLIGSTILQAESADIDGFNAGDLTLQFKAMTVIDDKKNGFAPSNGSGYLVKLKYETGEILSDGLKLGVGMYANGDAGLTE